MTVVNTRVSQPFNYSNPAWPVFSATAAGVSAAANLVALCWVGMWMGMTSKSNNLATLKTLIFVWVIPWFVISFASTMGAMLVIMPRLLKQGLAGTNQTSTAASQMMIWFPLIMAALAAGLSVAKDIIFFVWARRKLYSTFREQASRTLGQPQFVALPLPPRAIPTPPVISVQG